MKNFNGEIKRQRKKAVINRFYLQDYLSFKEANMEFDKGLIVFTGPSGAGKSILMDAFLATFGLKEAKAALSETTLEPLNFEHEGYGIEAGDELTLKELKKEKIRYFLNAQTISKKNLQNLSGSLIKHLHLKDTTDFESPKLIAFIDRLLALKDNKFQAFKQSFEDKFLELQQISSELNELKANEAKLEELKEFASFEIEKIASIDPKVEEYEELNELKKKLSSKEKIQESIDKAKGIFEYSTHITKVYELLGKDSLAFDEAMNEVTSLFEEFNDSLYELEELDIEYVLDRIEKLSSLQKRFGSIEEALDYKEQKQKELESYDNITFEKATLEKKLSRLSEEIEVLATTLHEKRLSIIPLIEEKINHYLGFLYLSNAKLSLEKKALDKTGCDEAQFILNGVNLDTISSGEFNRLRLALLTTMSEFEMGSGVLFLDEIDANLSGKESDAIATVLKQLSSSYQIFAISHQPQLTATATQHFMVDKTEGVSMVKELDHNEKIDEISRMISGESITKEARDFAINLLNSK